MFSCCNHIVCNSLSAIDAFPFSGYLRLSCEDRQAWGWNVFLFKQTRAAAVTISSSRFRAASRSQFTFPRSKMFNVSFLWGLSAFQCLLASPTETDGTIYSNVGKHACFKRVIVTLHFLRNFFNSLIQSYSVHDNFVDFFCQLCLTNLLLYGGNGYPLPQTIFILTFKRAKQKSRHHCIKLLIFHRTSDSGLDRDIFS